MAQHIKNKPSQTQPHKTEGKLAAMADALDDLWENRPRTPEATRRRRIAGTVGVLALTATLGVGVYKAGEAAGRDEVTRNVLQTGHREVQVGAQYDHDGDPSTPDRRLGTLDELANAANVPGMTPEETRYDLLEQLADKGMKSTEIPPGTTFTLPASAHIGSPVPDAQPLTK